MSKICAFDLSTVSTGYAIFVDGELESSGTIASKEKNWLKRVEHIYREIRKKINIEATYNRDMNIVVEKPLSLQNGDTTIKLAKLHGLLLSLSFDFDLPLFEIDNQTWKKHIAGTKATKKQTQDYIEKIYKIKTKTFDESDAVGIAIGWMAEEKYKTTIGKFEQKRPLPRKQNRKIRKTIDKTFEYAEEVKNPCKKLTKKDLNYKKVERF